MDSFELKRVRHHREAPTLALPRRPAASGTRGGEIWGTILESIVACGREQRRRRVLRDLEAFLAVRAGGWPRKMSRGGHQRNGAEAGDAFASN